MRSNIIGQLAQHLHQRSKSNAERARNKMQNLLHKELAETLQVKEWDGKMYIAFEGVPMIDITQLKSSPIETLQNIRSNIVDYKTSLND